MGKGGKKKKVRKGQAGTKSKDKTECCFGCCCHQIFATLLFTFGDDLQCVLSEILEVQVKDHVNCYDCCCGCCNCCNRCADCGNCCYGRCGSGSCCRVDSCCRIGSPCGIGSCCGDRCCNGNRYLW